MARKSFTLPDLGEGLHEAIIREWLVSVGNIVAVDGIVVEVETQKSAVEIPSPWAGKVAALHGNVGDEVTVGTVLFEVETEESDIMQTDAPKSEPMPKTLAESAPPVPAKEKESPSQSAVRMGPSVRALPMVRKYAEERGVELADVVGTGPDGTITRGDIDEAVGIVKESGVTASMLLRENEELLTGKRKVMAENMARSHVEIVPVFRFRKAKLEHWKTISGANVRIVRALVAACREAPALNAWYDSKRGVRMLHPHVNLGVAVDTEKGDLVVPVLECADTLSEEELPKVLDALIKDARAGKVSPLIKPTITLSNVGTVGEDEGGSAIIVPPQVAIVVASRIVEEACVLDGHVKPCKVLPLSLTFDHRVVTGAEALKFLTAMVGALEAMSDYEEK
ncbi:hypothetical protein A2673_03985 [Candidatus Kaiserbacteria bacterium RIFCSPHIGHO2_01_FULL_50_13]|uniref:Dihydrolipoamide acetyltransferase component of pyruvate dehydrogenase complex n=1 Tax=Candidatus Kaiserbacteria bacterium RIFCSPLOWO2_01_FULL_50_24 TaxID=1798507 RepID=A0A1F6END8_9BACT|nr:MAG: hypothetical protein A2673_03985 [Candidatus Kaiserbacteria bacterium RIFCSPHIGHO2_01_FULL_50_13]OGG75166.1 MAG: hypothetical protein A3A34_02325 [Candidatus Kaiserbacteria bacterium RIFCSPLOWO2_01_FULL_50_24]OGG81044.1 MAG: hypothetical protein A3H74_00915 [Candidatus Kaiserbacteria bacterium RIFCSPLOWO2_02_FULL_51_13]